MSYRNVPVAELQELCERGLANIAAQRATMWAEAKADLAKFKNEKRRKSVLVRLGWRKFVEYTDADADQELRKPGGAFDPSEWVRVHCWVASKPEETFERLLKLCKVAHREHHIALDSKDGELLYNWTQG